MENINIIEESASELLKYGEVSIALQVKTEFKIELLLNGLGGMIFKEVAVEKPYCLDYDADKGEGPDRWLKMWNLENWRIISAYEGNKRIGGAVLAFNTPGVNMLEGRDDIAVVWDIRIDAAHRDKGVGTAIFKKCIEWSKQRGCKRIKVETQNINVNACKFYMKQGASIGSVDRYAYKDKPGVTQLIWNIEI
jgi:GNAT superfamily N-acetyltransferase